MRGHVIVGVMTISTDVDKLYDTDLTVERSFAWLGRNRRLSKDYEYSVQSSETLFEIAATRLSTRE
jgi:putative transposase